METSKAEFIKNAVGSFVRWLLLLAAGILIKKGVISTDQSAVYIQQATPVMVGLFMGLVTLAWSIWQKKHTNTKIDKALELPANTDRAKLEAKV